MMRPAGYYTASVQGVGFTPAHFFFIDKNTCIPWRWAKMSYFSITNSLMLLDAALCSAISVAQPTLKRKLIVLCIGAGLLPLFLVYLAGMERYEMPPVQFWLVIALAVSGLAAALWIYRLSGIWPRKIEGIKQRSAKNAAIHAVYMKSLRYKEDEESAEL